MSNTQEFLDWFRGAAPYIKAHRKKTFVILIADDVIYSDRFLDLVHDIALLNHLGIKLVILHSSRKRIDAHLQENALQSEFHRNIRISDSDSMPYIIHAINEVRTRLESHLSMGLPNTPMSGSDISLIGGNFVIGMPLGVIDGIDMQHSGKVRDVKHADISELLAQNHVILLSNLGYSRTGEVFNLPSEELACEVARALRADKLIYLMPEFGGADKLVSTLSTAECETLLADPDLPAGTRYLLQQAIRAIQSQVKRVHFIDQAVDGGLLLELFTRDGYGSMVTNLFYEGSRRASIDDVGGILGLVKPLEDRGALVSRSREQIELEIDYFQVIEKDGMVIACIACIPDPVRNQAEIACLAVHDSYQGVGLGSQLLEIAAHRARSSGIDDLFTLTTQTSHWFLEHGFSEARDFELPESKLASYNPDRRSKILVKSV